MAVTRDRLVAEALALLDEGGLAAVTFRKLAQRLGVQAPTLYWHVKNKAALVTALAEAILAPVELPPRTDEERWQDWLSALAQRLRRALLAHPDGAQVVSQAQLSLRMAEISETAMRTLAESGLSLRNARLTVLAVERFTIGHVLEEQAGPPDVEGFDLDAYAARYPTVVRAVADYFEPGRTVDDLFTDTLGVILS
ncbi:TetR/AcrR family transcriptional regulator C-terminal domain-containing protein [Cryptosporangium phraense]|uniref:TetR family transcriptional regulator n=1 Tax=Cryptosporangium phraense TaxID=2593070 RepID=A0A545AN21_9ACTN|nr:TetR/AcrR family transcriptional regulator C-terminal domain-containing protein [Cryptosporangium phraense]TQS42683.1 TetR family transcriptional regulator [Cryptosporangium phraense]